MTAPPELPAPTRNRSAPQTDRVYREPRTGPHTGSFWAAPFARSTWLEFQYLVLAVPLSCLGLIYVVLTITSGLALGVTVAGLAVAATLVLGARPFGGLYRAAARAMLDTDIASPVPARPVRGFWRWLRASLLDGPGWRAVGFLATSFITALGGFLASVVFLAAALGGVTHWLWFWSLPVQHARDGSRHRGFSIDGNFFFDTPLRQVLLVLAGVFVFFLWAQVNGAMAHVNRLLAVNLLGPTESSLRLQDLESSRSRSVTDADNQLRRIERDLHDGTQSRLVALAMTLGDAKERLAGGEPAIEVLPLIDQAHQSAKDAIVELRDLARGIHPPALDSGLTTALQTLAARSPLPVTLQSELRVRPSPSVETMAYFCVAELITNTVKHAEATAIRVTVLNHGRDFAIRVWDNGIGGARLAAPGRDGSGTGLAGLAERVHTVDGQLELDSPVGGPTAVTITLPMAI